jgi:DNA end-binding protein Ku
MIFDGILRLSKEVHMSKRSVASGIIAFGLVSIPVKFYITASAERVNFNMITPKGNRVKQLTIDSVTREEIQYNECLKGYEVNKNQFVTFSRDELKKLGEEDDNGILEIKEFISSDSINLIHVEKTYYLDTGKGGDRAYRLFVSALKKRNKLAVAQWINRGRQHLIIIGVVNDTLIAYQMFYDNEVRSFELDCATYEPRDVEVDMACRLIDSFSNDTWDAKKYSDAYPQRIKQAVEMKLSGMTTPVSTNETTKINDLLGALEASLASKNPTSPVKKTKHPNKKSKAA